MDGQALRQVMGRFPTGVAVVAGRGADGAPYGLTVNSLTSVSLEPPLILVCVDRRASSHDPLISAETFAVSVLARGQDDVARRFASEPSAGRFEDVAWTLAPTGDPLVEGAVAWLACARTAVYDGGDHAIVVGRVQAADERDAAALVFYRGGFARVGE